MNTNKMTQLRKNISRKFVVTVGVVLVAISLVALGILTLWLTGRTKPFASRITADAMIFVDVPGRLGIDGTLQADGPAPIPVAAGSHTVTFFDDGSNIPVNVTLKTGEFQYLPNNNRYNEYGLSPQYGEFHVSAFPPNTVIEIPDCTPKGYTYVLRCAETHTLSAQLSPGIYTVKYSNPHFPAHEEEIMVKANTITHHNFSFITTIAEWNTWRQKAGDILESNYPSYHRGYGADDALWLPFEATGFVVEELFD